MNGRGWASAGSWWLAWFGGGAIATGAHAWGLALGAASLALRFASRKDPA